VKKQCKRKQKKKEFRKRRRCKKETMQEIFV
jgi:hypothetical protein